MNQKSNVYKFIFLTEIMSGIAFIVFGSLGLGINLLGQSSGISNSIVEIGISASLISAGILLLRR